jgi:hypothetical protein
MSQVFTQIGMFQAGLVISGVVAIIALLVWLVGLVLVLRGSTPAERASLLRAYGTCRPPFTGPTHMRGIGETQQVTEREPEEERGVARYDTSGREGRAEAADLRP